MECMGDQDQRVCVAHGGTAGVHLNGDLECRWVPRFRIWCGGTPAVTSTGWYWGWEVHDMARPKGDRQVVARGGDVRWRPALKTAARCRQYIIDERLYLLYDDAAGRRA